MGWICICGCVTLRNKMIISHAPNKQYREGWDRIYNNKESVMEYTDCDNCLRLEAENSDLQFEIDELEQTLEAFREAINDLNNATEHLV